MQDRNRPAPESGRSELLAAIADALDIPLPTLDAADEQAHTELLRRRTQATHIAVASALATDEEATSAAGWLRSETAALPVTYTPWVRRTDPEELPAAAAPTPDPSLPTADATAILREVADRLTTVRPRHILDEQRRRAMILTAVSTYPSSTREDLEAEVLHHAPAITHAISRAGYAEILQTSITGATA